MAEANRDRRQHSRVHVDAQVHLFTSREGRRVAFRGQVNDISEGGVSVYVSAEFDIGESLEIELTLPYSTSSTHAAAVVRTRDNYRYGLQFVHLHPKQHEALARACKLITLMK